MALPIRARLALWYSSVLAVILVGLGLFLALRLRADLLRGLDATLVSRAQEVALALGGPEEGEFQDVGDAPLLAGIPRGHAVAQIFAADGRLLQTSGEAEADAPLLPPSAIRKALTRPYRATVRVRLARQPYRVLAVPLTRRSAVLVVAASTHLVEAAVRRLILLLSTAGPVAIACCGAGGWWLARRALQPIDRMTRAASAIGADDPSRRLEVPGLQDEVGRLARTLNQMLERLQAGLEKQRRFIADASHELRTPLAILATEIDVAARSASTPPAARPILESLREEVTRMTRLVDDLLLLARMDEGRLHPSAARLDALALAQRVAERFAASAQSRGIALSAEGRSVAVWGDEGQLSRMLGNLLDNAIKHTPPGGVVRVSVDREGRSARFVVEDTGEGIAAEDLPRIFDRFYRADKARSEGGTGLGLAICRSIVTAHRGSIQAESEPGRGTRITVRLPADEA